MDDRNVKRKLAAIVSTDVKGYSRLMADNDVETVKSLKTCRKIITAQVESHKGRVVDAPGDNLLSEFLSVADAVECAVNVQDELSAHNKHLSRDRKMEFRIGIHLGDVIEDGDQIFGDGLNIAARLESMAPGGGICISGSAFEQVKNKLSFGYEFLGAKKLKNISGPVPVYRVLTDPAYSKQLVYKCKHDDPKFRRNKKIIIASVLSIIIIISILLRMNIVAPPSPSPVDVKDRLLRFHLPEKPSIAVLPFMNMSGDNDQEYFSDGLTEDLITDLSKVSGLFVIARNSVFSYKGQNVKIDKIGKELGVKYVLEGSVRKIENRVRITAQLIDAETEGHIWAERYDRDLNDIFSLQDEVRGKIVTALAVQLTTDDKNRIKTKKTKNLEAYDYFLRGMELHSVKMQDGLLKSRQLFEKAIELDPAYALAYSALGHTWLMEWIFGPDQDQKLLDKAYDLGLKAITIDEKESSGYSVLASVHLWRKQHDKAIEQSQKAVQLEPNNAMRLADLGEHLTWSGKPNEGLTYIEKAMRLDPKHPAWFLWNQGHAYYLTQQYKKAIEAFQAALIKDKNFWPSHIFTALCYDAEGEKQAAKIEIEKLSTAKKMLSLEEWKDRLPYRDTSLAAVIVGKLEKIKIE